MTRAFFDERYSAAGLTYGAAPNDFLAGAAGRLPTTGHALEIGAGEGRNAIFLASLGLDVLAVDQSEVGMRKAAALAADRGVKLRTQVVDLTDFDVAPGTLDVVVSIFVHLPPALRRAVHRRIVKWLKPGGVVVLEAYAPEQLPRATGGPKDPEMLVPLETLMDDFAGLTLEHRAATLRSVIEGRHHSGESAVVQIIGRKPS